MQAVAREITDPDETILRGFGKQLGNSKKEIMAVSKDLVVDQSADVAIEATRLAGEACNAIKASRESIRAALRELGAASDISEASGPTRAQLPPSARPVLGNIDPEWAMGSRPAAPAWFQRPPQARPAAGNAEPGWAAEARPVASGWPPVHTPATTAWPPHGTSAEAQDKGSGRRTVGPHAGYDERPGEQQRMAHLQREVCRIPSVPQGMVGVQADVSRTRA